MEGKNLNEEIDLRELLLKLWKYKVFILIFTVFALIASALAANMIKPKYKSQASVVPNLMEFKKIEISRLKDILKEYSNNTIINLNVEVNTNMILPYFNSEDVAISALKSSGLYNSSKYRSPLEQIEKEFKIKADVDKKDGSIKIEVIHSSPEVAAKFNLALIKEVNSRINQLYSPGKDINYLIITSMPETPYEPYFPKKFKIVFLSTFSAFLLSIFIALFYDWIRTEK